MTNKRWSTDSKGNHVLYFAPYGGEHQIATLFYDEAYDAAYEDNFSPWGNATKIFDRLVGALPERTWIE